MQSGELLRSLCGGYRISLHREGFHRIFCQEIGGGFFFVYDKGCYSTEIGVRCFRFNSAGSFVDFVECGCLCINDPCSCGVRCGKNVCRLRDALIKGK